MLFCIIIEQYLRPCRYPYTSITDNSFYNNFYDNSFSQWGATSINPQKYPSNIIYVDKFRFGENNVKDTINGNKEAI